MAQHTIRVLHPATWEGIMQVALRAIARGDDAEKVARIAQEHGAIVGAIQIIEQAESRKGA